MTTPPTGSFYDLHADRIEEIISKSVMEFSPACDPFWESVFNSSVGVASSDGLGRDWKVLKIFRTGLSGIVEQGGPRGDFTLYGDGTNTALGPRVHTQGLDQTWPSALHAPNATPFRMGIPMRSMMTNLLITLAEKQAEAHKAVIGQTIAPKLTSFGKGISLQLCNYLYLSQNSFYALSTLTDVSAQTSLVANSSPASVEMEIDLTGYDHTAARFFTGQRIQFYSSDGLTLRTLPSMGANTVFVVTSQDELTGKIRVRAIDNSVLTTFQSTTLADNDIIVFANSAGNSSTPNAASPYFTGIAGLNSWLKTGDANGYTSNNTNTLIGAERDQNNAINVNVHPEFKSMFYNNNGKALTEHKLRQIFRRWHAAKRVLGQTVDTVVASDGVWLAYQAQRIGRETIDRTNMLSSIRRGQGTDGAEMGRAGEFTFEMDGHRYTGFTSSFIESGTLYGIKRGGQNWKRMVPPDPQGVESGGEVASGIPFRFVGSITGTSRELPVWKTDSQGHSLFTGHTQLPGYIRMQLVPEQPAGIKMTGIQEERIYADS